MEFITWSSFVPPLLRIRQIERERRAEKEVETTSVSDASGSGARRVDNSAKRSSHSKSRRRTVTDTGQTSCHHEECDDAVDENTTVAELVRRKEEFGIPGNRSNLPTPLQPILPGGDPCATDDGLDTAEPNLSRPTQGNMAYPFKLATPQDDRTINASTITLTGAQGVVSRKGSLSNAKASGVLAVDDGEIVDASRPEPKSFVTAKDGLVTLGIEIRKL